MKLFCEPRRAAPVDCPYLPGRLFVQDYFFAAELDEYEFDVLLSAGWRRFGRFFFRPNCPSCRLCIPLRVDVERLKPTRSQRRVLAKARRIVMTSGAPDPRDEVWHVYRSHTEGRFDRVPDRKDFERTFFDDAVPSMQTEYRLDGELIAVGFLDRSSGGMSSAYFAFDPRWSRYSPGVLSVFRESDCVQSSGLAWYYLGYWVPGCPSMEYKGRFGPHQLLEWDSGEWVDPDAHSYQDVLESDVDAVEGQKPDSLPSMESPGLIDGDEQAE